MPPTIHCIDLTNDEPPAKKRKGILTIPPALSFVANLRQEHEESTSHCVDAVNDAFVTFIDKVPSLNNALVGEIILAIAAIYDNKKMSELITKQLPQNMLRKIGKQLPFLLHHLYNEAAVLGNQKARDKLDSLRESYVPLKYEPYYQAQFNVELKTDRLANRLTKTIKDHVIEAHTFFPTTIQTILAYLLYKLGVAFSEKQIQIESQDKNILAHIFIFNAANLGNKKACKWSASYLQNLNSRMRLR